MKPAACCILIAWLTAASTHALQLQDDAKQISVTTAHYKLTIDKARGVIKQLNDRNVQQSDAVDSYRFGGDGKATVTVNKLSAKHATVIVSAHYVLDHEPAPSKIRARYRYVFHDDSPVVGCFVRIDQDRVMTEADVFMTPAWRKLTVLDFGDVAGHRKPFSQTTSSLRLFMKPADDKLFTASEKQIRDLAALTRPNIARTKPLLHEQFDDKSNWTELSGRWSINSRQLVEDSPKAQHAWAVAGSETWRDFAVESTLYTNDGSGHAYLCGRWQDPDNHYALVYLEFPAWTVRIDRVQNGTRVILAEVGGVPDLRTKPGTNLILELRGTRLRAFRNDELLLEAYDGNLTAGRAALGVVADYRMAFFDLKIDELKPLDENVPAISITQPPTRHAFYRDETNAFVPYQLMSDKKATDLTATFSLRHSKYLTSGITHSETVKIAKLAADTPLDVKFPLQPAKWRSGDYELTAVVKHNDRVIARDKSTIYLRRRPNNDRFLVNAWDMGDASWYAKRGFNRFKVYALQTMSRWLADGSYRTPDDPTRYLGPSAWPKIQSVYDKFDDCIRHGMWGYIQFESIRRVDEKVREAWALKRDGKSLQDRPTTTHEKNQPRPVPWHPANIKVIQNHWRHELKPFAEHPAWQAALLDSEVGKSLDVYGNDYFLEMARKELGFDVPEDAVKSWGMTTKTYQLPNDGVIESDDRHYRFYRWWWQRGLGHAMLCAKVGDVIHELRPDIRVWHDPALRQPFVRGRHKDMDQLLHWTYCWPAVERIPMIADEMRRAAVGDQLPVLMLQVIAWGSVPIPQKGPHWDYIKRGYYLIAHSPAVMRQATWMAFSRGIGGLSYHALETTDQNAMYEADDRATVRGVGYRGYMYSNPDALTAITQLSEDVLQPYGMVTKKLSPAKGHVALLLSTAMGVLTGRDSMDFKAGEAGRMYSKLQAAHIAVDVVYEIDLEERGLDGYTAIALPGSRVLPRHIYDMIRKFTANGGYVIADQHLAQKFDNVIDLPMKQGAWSPGRLIQEAILAESQTLRDKFDDKIERWVDCDSPSVALSTLVDGPAKLLFTTNTLRQAGDYVGHHGKVLDDGVPQTAAVKIRETNAVIYDALSRRIIKTQAKDGYLHWKVSLGPGEGRMFAIMPKAIGDVHVQMPAVAKKGGAVKGSIRIDGMDRSLTPLRITIRDSQGMVHDYSDYAVAHNGRAAVSVPIATNDPSGHWSVTAQELYGGNHATAYFQVASDEVVAEARFSRGFVPVPEMWRFRKDPDDNGEQRGWHKPGGKETWQTISTWDFWDQAIGVHEGVGWYATDLVIPPAGGKRVALKFGAVDENYSLWINGNFIGDNLAAGAAVWDKPVSVDITDHYRPGTANHIVVRVNNTIKGGGIWKPVRIISQ